MNKIQSDDLSFVEYVRAGLKNLCGPTFSRLAVLVDHAFQVMTDSFNSHSRTARSSTHASISKTVTRALEQLHRLPDVLKRQRIMRFKESLDRRRRVLISLDDTLAKKRGKKIHGAKKFYDHTEERTVQAQNLVDAVVKQGETILGVSYRMVDPKAKEPPASIPSTPARAAAARSTPARDPDLETKQDLAIEILDELVEELGEAGYPRRQIWVETDAWYPSKKLLGALRRLGVKFMLAIKKSSRVVLPDKARMLRKETQQRGRPIKILTRELRIAKYFKEHHTARYFTDKATGEKIFYKEATLNMKSFGRVKVFTFRPAAVEEWRYFITPVKTTGAVRAWELYRERWEVEVMHHNLKQYFGMLKCKCRREEAIKGHFDLVYWMYSTYRAFRTFLQKAYQVTFTAQRVYDQVAAHVKSPPPPDLLWFQPRGRVAALT